MDYNVQSYVVTLLVRCQVQVKAHDETEAVTLANQSFGYDENTTAELPQVLDVQEGTL
jgi:hypothetical protein